MSDEPVVVGSVSGMLEAEIVRGLLESQGVSIVLSGESAGTVYGLGVGPLGRVDLLVPRAQADQARRILEDYRKGKLAGEA
jgi:hypothetical protein